MGFHVPPLLSYQGCLALDLYLPACRYSTRLKPRYPSHHRVPRLKEIDLGHPSTGIVQQYTAPHPIH